MKKFLLPICFILLFAACNNDDDGISFEQRSDLDDDAIIELMNDYYFGDNGRITRFDEDDDADDNETPLAELAQDLGNGLWIAKNPEATQSNGETVIDNDLDSILISYNQYRFTSNDGNDDLFDERYGALSIWSSTLSSSGSPDWDPLFYFSGTKDDQDFDEFEDPELFEIEGFVEGIKEFTATGTGVEDVPFFQGVIIVPSRLAFGRDAHIVNGQLSRTVFFDNCFLFEFELHRLVDRQ